MDDHGRHDRRHGPGDRAAVFRQRHGDGHFRALSGTASLVVTNQPPTVATAASASPNPVTGASTDLSVLGADDAGESNLTYTWSTPGTPPAAVTFLPNGSNAAQNTTATFSQANTN